MPFPNKKHCKKCEYKGSQPCCPECSHPNLPKSPISPGGLRFCPRDEAEKIAESMDQKPKK